MLNILLLRCYIQTIKTREQTDIKLFGGLNMSRLYNKLKKCIIYLKSINTVKLMITKLYYIIITSEAPGIGELYLIKRCTERANEIDLFL